MSNPPQSKQPRNRYVKSKKTKNRNIYKIILIVIGLWIALILSVIAYVLLTGRSGKETDATTSSESVSVQLEETQSHETEQKQEVENTEEVTDNTEFVETTVPTETESLNNASDLFADYHVGDYISFGSYEQDNNTSNGAETIEWLILEKQADKMLLVSSNILDSRRFHSSAATVTWDNSSMRTWLNRAFYNIAFSSEEQAHILTSTVTADKNPKFNTTTGSDTQDKIFLLSVSETEMYLPDNQSRFCTSTTYATKQNAYVNSSNGGSWWLMRTPGATRNKVASVNTDGTIDYDGGKVESDRGGVRPAMWIDTTSWLYDKSENSNSTTTSEYILPFSSDRLLTEADISFLSQKELKIARNEIFARHGRLFDDKELQAYFDAKAWYSGYITPQNFSESTLSTIELANVNFIKSHEQSDSSNNGAWKTAYLDYLEKMDAHEYSNYSLILLDTDDVPELFISGPDEASGSCVISYKNGKVVEQHLSRLMGAYYIPKSGLVYNFNGNMGYYSADIYRLNNNGFTSLFHGEQEEDGLIVENGETDYSYKYSIGNRTVTEEEFYEAIDEIFNFNNAVWCDEYLVSYNQIIQKISNW